MLPGLSQRLLAAAGMARRLKPDSPDTEGSGRDTFADIGCDHAYLAITLLLEGDFSFAVASDLRKGPLLRAKENAKRYGVDEKMRFVCADGLQGLVKEEAFLAAVCGMGGDVMTRIITQSDPEALGIRRLVLSPHTKWEVVRRSLYERGYRLLHESFVQEEGKYYPVLGVDVSAKAAGTDTDDAYARALRLLNSETSLTKEEALDLLYRFGPILIAQADDTLMRFLDTKSARMRHLIDGLPADTGEEDRRRMTYEVRLTDAALSVLKRERT